MRINEIADYHELWGAKFIDIDNVYDRLQFFQAYCNNVKPIVYCSEVMGRLIFNMQYGEKEKNWRGFNVKLDKRIPLPFILIYSKKNSWKTKQPVLFSMVIQFDVCSKKDEEKVCHILVNNLKQDINV